MSSVERSGHLRHHSCNASIGMIGGCGSCTTADGAIESFQAAGGAKFGQGPIRMRLLDEEIGNGLSEISPEGLDSGRLRVAIAMHNLAIAAQHGFPSFGLIDGVELFEDALLAAAALLGRKFFFRQSDGLVNVAEFVEEAALLLGVEEDSA